MPVMDGYEATRRIKAGEMGRCGNGGDGENGGNGRDVEGMCQMSSANGPLSALGNHSIAKGKSKILSGAERSLSGAISDQAIASRAINPKSKIPHLQSKTPVIIALTASAFEEDRMTILAAGCDDIVNKPFRKEIIFEKMAKYLGVRYLYAEAQAGEDIASSDAAAHSVFLKRLN